MSSDVILEPCPFCGSEKVRTVRGPMFGTAIVRCHGCGMAAYMQGPGDLLEGWNARAGGGGFDERAYRAALDGLERAQEALVGWGAIGDEAQDPR